MMKTTEIILIRHGETAANSRHIIQGQTDTLLNETGEQQAELIAERLRDMEFAAIYASDLKRAMRTAEAIARPHGCAVIPCPGLREWHLGAWQGKTAGEIAGLYPDEYRNFLQDSPETHITGGESRREFQQRISKTLVSLAQRHSGGRILLVSHGGVIGMILRHVLHAEQLAFSHRPRTENASFSKVLFFEDGTWQLACWNDISHLRGTVNDAGKW